MKDASAAVSYQEKFNWSLLQLYGKPASGLGTFVAGTGLAKWKTPSHPAIAANTES